MYNGRFFFLGGGRRGMGKYIYACIYWQGSGGLFFRRSARGCVGGMEYVAKRKGHGVICKREDKQGHRGASRCREGAKKKKRLGKEGGAEQRTMTKERAKKARAVAEKSIRRLICTARRKNYLACQLLIPI